MPATLLKKTLLQRCYPMNFVKFFRTTFLQNIFGRCFSQFNIRCVTYTPESHSLVYFAESVVDLHVVAVP